MKLFRIKHLLEDLSLIPDKCVFQNCARNSLCYILNPSYRKDEIFLISTCLECYEHENKFLSKNHNSYSKDELIVYLINES